jgi:S1-C subfamily serine protease
MGLVVSKDGIIVTDKKLVSGVMEYVAVLSDGTEVPIVSIYGDKKSSVGFFKAKPKEPIEFIPVTFSNNDLKLGQTVISIGGTKTNAVSVGRVISLNTRDIVPLGTSTPISKVVTSIEADVSPKDIVVGGPIVSLSGEIVGMSLSDFSSSKIYLPSAVIKKEFSIFQSEENSVTTSSNSAQAIQ